MNEYMLYQGKPVHVKPCTRQQFDTAVLDAKRMMGFAKAKPEHWDRDGKFAQYLEPPEEGSCTWEYATRILSLRWPIVRIFLNGYQIMVSESDLQELGG